MKLIFAITTVHYNYFVPILDPPVIVAQPPATSHLSVKSSSDKTTLNCMVEGEGIVYWQKDGVDIAGSEMPIAQGGNTLDIMPDNITSTNVGMYRCVASNTAGSVMSNYTSVTVTGECIGCRETYTEAHTHTHRCTRTHTGAHTHTHTRAHSHTQMHTCPCTSTESHTHAHTQLMYTYTHAHTCINMHPHANLHTRMYMR